MKFTVETEPLIRMLQMLKESNSRLHRRFAPVQLHAARTRVRIEQGEFAGEVEALVWRPGYCSVSGKQLMTVLKHSMSDGKLTFETDSERLRAGRFTLPAFTNSAPETIVNDCRLFFASSFGVVPSELQTAC